MLKFNKKPKFLHERPVYQKNGRINEKAISHLFCYDDNHWLMVKLKNKYHFVHNEPCNCIR